MHAVYEVDVGVAAAQEQRAVAIRLARVGVAAGVAGNVGLGFDDAPARAAVRGIAHERLSDEKARERGGIDRKIGTLQPLHGINSILALVAYAVSTVHLILRHGVDNGRLRGPPCPVANY